jgi:hypothetical protein
VIFDKKPKETSWQANSQIRIVFDRPIEEKDYTNQISFNPEISFSARTSSQSIVITLEDNFAHNEDYELKINNDIYDKSGIKMKDIHTEEFETTEPRYAYLERNYSDPSDNSPEIKDSAEDFVKISNLSGENETYFSHPEIVFFSANNEFVAIVTREEETDSLYVVNVLNKNIQKIELLEQGRISNIDIATFGPTVLYSFSTKESLANNESFKEDAFRLEYLNAETGEIEVLKNSKNENIQAYSVDLDIYGQFAIIQDEGQNFFAISPFGDVEPIILGLKTATFGFSKSNREILFRNNDIIEAYGIASGKFAEILSNKNEFINNIYRNNTYSFYSYNTFVNGGARSFVEKSEQENVNNIELLWSNRLDTDEFLADFNVSFDDTLLALHKNQNNCIYDALSYNNNCKTALIEIYDTKNNTTAKEFRGVDLIWLP